MGNPDTYSWMTGEPDDQSRTGIPGRRGAPTKPGRLPTRPRPYANPVQQPYANPVQQPYANPVQQPYANPVQQPYANPVQQPYANPVQQPYANPVQQPYANPVQQPRNPVQQPYANPVQQPYANPVQQPYAQPSHYTVPQRPYESNGLVTRSLPASRQVSRRSPAASSVSLQPARQLRGQRRAQVWTRRQRTWPQRVGGLLIAGACVAAVAWYVPRVIGDDRQLFTGTVTSSGIVTLNFAVSGEIGKVNVHLDQRVRKGQVLAAEYAPSIDSVVAADKAAIAAEQAKMAQLRAAEAADPAAAPGDNAQLEAEKAQLALDEAQLETDEAKVTASEIVAPSAGIVIAANGQPGETVTSAGIRNYFTDSAQRRPARARRSPCFPRGRRPSTGPRPASPRCPWSRCASRPAGRSSRSSLKARSPGSARGPASRSAFRPATSPPCPV